MESDEFAKLVLRQAYNENPNICRICKVSMLAAEGDNLGTLKIRHYCSPECLIKLRRVRQAIKGNRWKQRAMEYKGGKCIICEYSRCPRALHFHHIDPKEKEHNIRWAPKQWDILKAELDKCILLCSNCHAEVHAGLRDISLFVLVDWGVAKINRVKESTRARGKYKVKTKGGQQVDVLPSPEGERATPP
jgi:hypothetical protein